MPSKPEVIKEKRKNDKEFVERCREYSKKWRESNLDHARELDRNKANKSRNESRETYNAYMREWTAKNKDRLNAARREKLKTDNEYAERVRERGRERHDPIKHKDQRLKMTYGITLEEYKELFDSQHGRCIICGRESNDCGKHGLVVDHCHNSKKIRGLLCSCCNTALGQLKDNVSFLENAIKYLKERG